MRWLLIPLLLLCSSAYAGVVPPALLTTPTSISGLQLWLKADVGYSAGSWADQSGQGHGTTTAAADPTLTSGVFNNSIPGVCFNGTQYVNNVWLGEPGTIIVVFYANWQSNNSAAILGARSSNTIHTAYSLESAGQGTGHLQDYNYLGYQRFTSADTGGNALWSVKGSHVYNFANIVGITNNGTTLTEYKSEFALHKQATISGTAAPITAAVIGATYDNTGAVNEKFEGCIGEIIMYDHVITPAQFSQVIAYLDNRFSLQPSGQYMMVAEQGGDGTHQAAYSDPSPYFMRSSDGITITSLQPSNIVAAACCSRNDFAVLEMPLLRDQDGKLIQTSDGRYWAVISQNGRPQNFPFTIIQIFSSTDFFDWDFETSFDMGPSGYNLVTGSSAAAGPDGWFKDNSTGNLYIRFNAAGSPSPADAPYYLQVTNLAHGATTFAGSVTNITGTAMSTIAYSSYTNEFSGTNYMIVNTGGGHDRLVSSTTSAITGFNTGPTNYSCDSGTPFSTCEWGQLLKIKATGKYLLVEDADGTGMQSETVNDPALSSPTGFTQIPTISINTWTVTPQGPQMVYTPSLPGLN